MLEFLAIGCVFILAFGIVVILAYLFSTTIREQIKEEWKK